MAKMHSAFFALCMALTAPAVALAADGPSPPPGEKQKTADEWAEEAFALVSRGEYAKAVAAYQRAYQISADGRNLYNIANIYDRKLHEREVAADYYRRYLHLPQTEPDLTKRATERLAALKEEEEAIRRNAASAPPNASQNSGNSVVVTPMTRTSPSNERADTTRSTMQITGLVAGGAGIVLLGAGAVFGLIAKSKNDDAGKLCTGNACNNDDAIRLTDDARRAATFSTIGFVAGGVALVGGLLVYFLAPNDKKGTALHVGPKIGPQTAGITLGGAWR